MDTVDFVDTNGRKYKAVVEGELRMLIGPPEGLVDELGLPEPFATRLHNVLYERGILSYTDVRSKPQHLLGALQEALSLDVQKLHEAFFNYSKEEVHHA